MLTLGGRHGIATVTAWGHLFCGRVAYERNDLETAHEHFVAGLALRDRSNLLCVWNTTVGLCLTLDASGRGDEARRLALDALEVAKASQQRATIEGLR